MTSRTTSLAARGSARPAATQRARIFVYLVRRGNAGATLEELESVLMLPGNTVRPRRLELEEKGLVADSGKRRSTVSGRLAIVWVVPEPIRSAALVKITAKEAA
jgi:predicted ArsR family transcriptional regulator